MSNKSLEQRLYEAYRNSKGVLLTADDVGNLINDDVVGTRISNQACAEAGEGLVGFDCVSCRDNLPTWKQFVETMRD